MTLSVNNKSGYKGVCFETRANKWRAYIGVAGEKIRLGYFSNIEDAINARKEAEELFSFKNKKGLKPINYVIYKLGLSDTYNSKEYMRGYCGLVQAMIDYDWKDTFFITFSLKIIKKAIIEDYNVRPYMSFTRLKYDNDEIIKSWLNGNSIRTISSQSNTSRVNVSNHIKEAISRIKEDLSNEN